MTLTLINWATRVWNPHLGCDRVSEGCDSCYAIVNAWIRVHNPNAKISSAYNGVVHKDSDGHLDWTGRVNLLPDRLGMPFTWPNHERVFADSMSDLFHAGAPGWWIAQVLAVVAACPRHDFLVPTKRHGRMRSLLNSPAFRAMYKAEYARRLPTLNAKNRGQAPTAAPWPIPNLHLGVSAENHEQAELRIPALLACRQAAGILWVSYAAGDRPHRPVPPPGSRQRGHRRATGQRDQPARRNRVRSPWPPGLDSGRRGVRPPGQRPARRP